MKDLKTTRGMPDLYDEDVERILLLKIYVLKLSRVLIFKNLEHPLLKIRPYFRGLLARVQISSKKKYMNLRTETGRYYVYGRKEQLDL